MSGTHASKTDLVRTGGGSALVAALALGLAADTARGTDRAATVDRELLRQAPAVIRYLKDRGYKDVGVLKFRVKRGDEPVSDRAGTINLDLAARLEIALVLADDVKEPVGIIRDASAVAATLPGASHLTKEGRRALFRGRYRLAWGDERVEADAFLTGVAVVSPDLRRVGVTLLAFGRDGEALDRVAQFTALTDAPTLIASGESFMVRGAFDSGGEELVQQKVVETAARVKAAQEASPLQDPAAPVALEIDYDDRRVPLEIRGGRALIREPMQGQKVSFVLRKVDGTPHRYGVVLKVNGQNTLDKERSDPLQCRKWVLSTDHPAITVRGFQVNDKTAESFRVLSPEGSKRNEINYGADVGMITLVVFREARAQDEPPPLDDEAEDLAAMTRGAMPKERPQTLAALKYQLRQGAAQAGSRGLIIEGRRIGASVRHVDFRPEPTPVMSVTITYYRP